MGIDSQFVKYPENFTEFTQGEKDVFWMEIALDLAEQAKHQGEIPVGALIVKGDDLISTGWNQSIQNHDPSSHAEIVAIRNAGKRLQNYRLLDTTLYVTLEPCPMCASAMVHSRIHRLVYAAKDFKTGAVKTVENLLDLPMHNHQVVYSSGVLEEKASNMLSRFFKERRTLKKSRKNSKQKLAKKEN